MLANNIAIFLMLFVFALSIIDKKIQFKINRLNYFLILIFFFSTISIIYSCDTSSGFKVLEKYLVFLIFPISIQLSGIGEKRIQIIKYAFVLSVVLVFFYALLLAGYYSIQTGTTSVFNPENLVLENRFTYHRLMENANISATVFALYLTLSIVILFETFIIKKSHSKHRLKAILLIGFLGLIIALMNSFTAYMALGVISISTAYYLKIKLKYYLFFLIPILLSITFFSIKTKGIDKDIFKYNLTDDIHNTNWNSLNVRLAKWECTLNVIKETFPFGIGVGCAQKTLNKKYKEMGFQVGYDKKFSTHNQFLHYLLESGIITLLLFITLLVYGLYYSIKKKNYYLYTILILLSISSLTDNFLIVNKGIVFFAFFICLASKD
ncbi:O-antigen ligase family protein [uncultured Winogradskyella sp.]|uniref:O-antigen ligase family protein n=1 Tax=uncultured Winogradskyella sp. TaxID=395353 RepID=UPI00260408D5|nr:O-antigen ligase family protein [uncultured Winogradskyella sp.]